MYGICPFIHSLWSFFILLHIQTIQIGLTISHGKGNTQSNIPFWFGFWLHHPISPHIAQRTPLWPRTVIKSIESYFYLLHSNTNIGLFCLYLWICSCNNTLWERVLTLTLFNFDIPFCASFVFLPLDHNEDLLAFVCFFQNWTLICIF